MKSSRSALMKWLARSLVKSIPLGLGDTAVEFATEVLPVVSNDVYEWWRGDKNAEERRKELEDLAKSSPEELKEEVKVAVEEAAQAAREGQLAPAGATSGPAIDPSPELLGAVERYLEQVPDAIRRSMRRPEDTQGRTVPPHLMPRTGSELGALLPQRPPRYKAGDKPLPGVDLILVSPLGAGGFGEVWRAHKTHLNQDVALKFCLDPTASTSLRNETALLSRLMNGDAVHPGIVRLLNTYNDCTALEYEFVEGGDVAAVIRSWHVEGKKPEPRVVIDAIRQIAEIVAFAHGLNPPLVHRDLKPQNILVNKKSDGSLRFRLTDFGIGGIAKDAKQAAAAPSGFTQRSTTSLHGSYSAMYASPQQMRAERPSPTDDVYSLGVIFWQMANGDLNDGAPGGTSWMRDLEAEGYPKAVVELMSSCFERRAEKRPATAGALVEELKKAYAPPPMPERGGGTTRPPPRQPEPERKTVGPVTPPPADPRVAELASLKGQLRGLLDARPLDVTAAQGVAQRIRSLGLYDAEANELIGRVPQRPTPVQVAADATTRRNTLIIVSVIVLSLLLSACIVFIFVVVGMQQSGGFDTSSSSGGGVTPTPVVVNHGGATNANAAFGVPQTPAKPEGLEDIREMVDRIKRENVQVTGGNTELFDALKASAGDQFVTGTWTADGQQGSIVLNNGQYYLIVGAGRWVVNYDPATGRWWK